MYGLSRVRDAREGRQLSPKRVGVCLVDREGVGGILHLADIDYIVRPFKDKIYLHAVGIGLVALEAPAVCFDMNAADTKGLAYLRKMQKAKALKGQPLPNGLGGGCSSRRPEVLVRRWILVPNLYKQ